jgi:hypothetical protein
MTPLPRLWALAAVLLVACSETGLSGVEDEVDVPDTDPATDFDPGTDPDTDAGTDPDTDAGTDPDTDTDTDAGTDPDTDTDPGTDTDTDSDSDSDSDSQGETPNPCGPPTIDPYFTGGVLGGFQSIPGSGYQTTITATFPCAAARAEVVIRDPDFPANLVIAYDAAGNELDRATFVGDGIPQVFTTDRQVVYGPGITRIELVPDPLDYVAYDLVVYY